MKFTDFVDISQVTLKALAKNNLLSPEDLLTIFPKDYNDTRSITLIKNLSTEKKSLIQGRISNITYRNFGKKLLRFVVDDGTGLCNIVLFRFYPNQVAMLKKAKYVRCYGKINSSPPTQMIHCQWAVIKDGECSLKQSLSATYKLKKIPDSFVTQTVSRLLKEKKVINLIPAEYLRHYNLMSFVDALYYVHALTDSVDEQYLSRAKFSIKFEEMLAYKLAEKNIRKNMAKALAPKLFLDTTQKQEFYKKLPYDLTKAQLKAIDEILADIKQSSTMVRLLQGDVGAGKTIVAVMALYAAAKSGYQGAIMAPTEILAEQHYSFLCQYLSDFDLEIIPLLGKLPAKQTKDNLAKIKNSKNCIVVGTHAIFQQRVEYSNLGLVVIDEQHKFGVRQRLALITKSSISNNKLTPHQLIVSATPIPRTLAMSLYNNLKLSILDELPPNRKAIITTILNRDKKQDLILKLKAAVSRGEQIYWVCTLVEESENTNSLQDVKTLYEELSQSLGVNRVGLVYGSMKSEQKIQQMNDFKAAKYDVLIATTVIEVGVDVPNASIMIIDNAERLGISQLHQLRGRVGRGAKQSFCILLYGNMITEVGRKRLSLVRESQNGFYLAEKDLEIRGAGDVFGKEQSGISTFKTFSINEYYNNYDKVSELANKIEKNHPEATKKLINRWFYERINYVEV